MVSLKTKHAVTAPDQLPGAPSRPVAIHFSHLRRAFAELVLRAAIETFTSAPAAACSPQKRGRRKDLLLPPPRAGGVAPCLPPAGGAFLRAVNPGSRRRMASVTRMPSAPTSSRKRHQPCNSSFTLQPLDVGSQGWRAIHASRPPSPLQLRAGRRTQIAWKFPVTGRRGGQSPRTGRKSGGGAPGRGPLPVRRIGSPMARHARCWPGLCRAGLAAGKRAAGDCSPAGGRGNSGGRKPALMARQPDPSRAHLDGLCRAAQARVGLGRLSEPLSG
jgi:hypothetical protein